MNERSRSVDFNSLLQCANLGVAGLLGFALAQLPDNEYVDRDTLLLALLLCAQTGYALFLERRRRDPFVILLAFATIFYYEFRIFTLTVYSYSTVFERYAYDAADSNYALVFIIVANIFLYGGLRAVRLPQQPRILADNWRATSPGSVVFLLITAIVFAYFKGGYWNEDNVPRALSFLVSFLDPGVTTLMALSYYWLFKASLPRHFALAVALLIILDIMAHTLWGSRSALVYFAQNCMFVALAISGCISFRRKYVLAGVILLPLLVVLLVVSFTVSTYNRALKASDGAVSLDVGRALATASESGSTLLSGPDLDLVLSPIADRAGFFDFSAEIIAHRDEYSPVLNLSSYAKSIIDNILTPGFDVYDWPKIANALQFVYRDWGVPSKRQASEFYQSDQLGIYGEFYALFGYPSVLLLSLTACLLKCAYVRMFSPSPFLHTMKRIVVLYVFARLVDSFGVDWIIGEVIPVVAAIYIYAFLFRAAPAGAASVAGITSAATIGVVT